MSVVIETTIGDITVDLFLQQRPRTCLNFLKLCKLKYYNYNLFHTIQNDFIAQTGDPTGSGHSGSSVWGILEGVHKRFFEVETAPKIKHSKVGLISMVSSGDQMTSSQFFFTLGTDLFSLDESHCVFGEVVDGLDVLRKLNETICDEKFRPYKDVRITHTVVLEDPYENPRGFREPSRSPSPSAERMQGGRIAADEDINDRDGKTEEEVNEMLREQEARAQATILEIVGDLPDADMAPPENVLFVCKLNPVTSDDDLEIIFSRFGRIKACEVIRDKQSGDSLQYAFVEFAEQKSCEDAYLKMDNVLIDDRRIHVDFSQSVAKLQWKGKGRGVVDLDDQQRNGRGGGGLVKGGASRNPRINFNDKNWKNGRSGGGRGRGGGRRSTSPVERRGDKERPREMRRNSPLRRRNNEGRSRSRSPRRNRSREIEQQRSRRQRDEERNEADRYRGQSGRRLSDNRRNSRPRDNRSRSKSPRRRSTPPRRNDNEERHRHRRRSDSRERQTAAVRRRHDNRREMAVDRTGKSPEKRSHRDASPSRKRSSSTSEDDSASRRRESSDDRNKGKAMKSKSSKQKRNKTKKSKVSRTSSDDDSSSSSSESEQESRRKHRKKSKKKHKKRDK